MLMSSIKNTLCYLSCVWRFLKRYRSGILTYLLLSADGNIRRKKPNLFLALGAKSLIFFLALGAKSLIFF